MPLPQDVAIAVWINGPVVGYKVAMFMSIVIASLV